MLGDSTQSLSSRGNTGIEFHNSQATVFFSFFLYVLYHLHLPLKDVSFMKILYEKFGEEVMTVNSYSFKNNQS